MPTLPHPCVEQWTLAIPTTHTRTDANTNRHTHGGGCHNRPFRQTNILPHFPDNNVPSIIPSLPHPIPQRHDRAQELQQPPLEVQRPQAEGHERRVHLGAKHGGGRGAAGPRRRACASAGEGGGGGRGWGHCGGFPVVRPPITCGRRVEGEQVELESGKRWSGGRGGGEALRPHGRWPESQSYIQNKKGRRVSETCRSQGTLTERHTTHGKRAKRNTPPTVCCKAPDTRRDHRAPTPCDHHATTEQSTPRAHTAHPHRATTPRDHRAPRDRAGTRGTGGNAAKSVH